MVKWLNEFSMTKEDGLDTLPVILNLFQDLTEDKDKTRLAVRC